MSIIEAIILGIIQGLTEFLPVSSSGHLELGKAILGTELGDEDLLFSIVVHAATALSTVVVFRQDIVDLLKGIFKFEWNQETQFAAKILLSMIPVGVVGVLFKDEIEAMFFGKPEVVGLMLLVTGVLLLFTHYRKQTEGTPVTFGKSVIIGIAQMIAILPGISRSGSTIATALLVGVDKSQAARFSFLMVLPPIIGANLLEIKDFVEKPVQDVSFAVLAAGFVAAFVSGLFACQWMISLVKKSKLIYFAVYCIIVGLIASSYLWLRA